MAWTEWLRANWVDLTQTVGVVGGLIYTACALRRDAQMQRVSSLFTLTGQHHELWLELSERPELARILRADVDANANPVTATEEIFVNLLIQNLISGYEAVKVGVLREPKGLGMDIRSFLSLPIPQVVWNRTREMRDPDFVRFVEKRITKPRGSPAAST